MPDYYMDNDCNISYNRIVQTWENYYDERRLLRLAVRNAYIDELGSIVKKAKENV